MLHTFAPVINCNPELQVNAEVPLTIRIRHRTIRANLSTSNQGIPPLKFSKPLTLGVASGGINPLIIAVGLFAPNKDYKIMAMGPLTIGRPTEGKSTAQATIATVEQPKG